MQHPGRRKQWNLLWSYDASVVHPDGLQLLITFLLHYYLLPPHPITPPPIQPPLIHCRSPSQGLQVSVCVFTGVLNLFRLTFFCFCLYRGPSAVPWWMSYGFLSSASDDSNRSRNHPSWSKQMRLSTCTPSMTVDYQAKRPWPKSDTSLLFLELGGEKITGQKFGGEEVGFSIWGGEACHFKQLVTENNNRNWNIFPVEITWIWTKF